MREENHCLFLLATSVKETVEGLPGVCACRCDPMAGQRDLNRLKGGARENPQKPTSVLRQTYGGFGVFARPIPPNGRKPISDVVRKWYGLRTFASREVVCLYPDSRGKRHQEGTERAPGHGHFLAGSSPAPVSYRYAGICKLGFREAGSPETELPRITVVGNSVNRGSPLPRE